MSRKFVVTTLLGAVLAAVPAPAALAAPGSSTVWRCPATCSTRAGARTRTTAASDSSRTSTTTSSAKHWYGLSDRGPGGGTLHYETRVQRFKLDIDKKTGAISKFKIVDTIIFKDELGKPLDGIAPDPTSELGSSFDPEGFVVHPETDTSWSPTSTGRRSTSSTATASA